MGFFINEITYELKQHLNLSEKAWDIIYNDISNFYGEDGKQSLSGFLNKIFLNYCQEAMASIDTHIARFKEELLALASKNQAVFGDEANSEKIISFLVKEFEGKLREKNLSYPKGIGKKFRVNRQNVELLRESEASVFYNDSIGSYLKAIYEEYTTLPSAQRESIFFKETKDACNFAISQHRKLKISLQQRISPKTNSTYTRRFYVTPYAVLTDKNGIFNYLVGISEEIKSDGSIDEKRISSFRISRIKKISVMSSMSGFLSRQKAEEIDKAIKAKSLQYMAGDIITVEVNFTDKGLELFNRQIYLRPTVYEKTSKNTYTFQCTELQAVHYFFRFGRDAHIIKPDHLREKFISYYQEALNSYK